MTIARTPLSDETRERILNAAETLFAEQGFSRTSLRSITSYAQVNLAAVNYHFGSKEALIQAVFQRRLVPLNRERLQQLERLQADGVTPDVEDILAAFIAPMLKSAPDNDPGEVRFIRLLGRTHAGASRPLREFVQSLYAEALERFEEALSQALPWLPRKELSWRIHFLVGTMAYSMAGPQARTLLTEKQLPETDDRQALQRRLIAFLAAGLRAPTGEG